MAWRDAALSHTGNGIYGAMWVAAMNAAAFVLGDPAAVIQAGLAEIPPQSRLAEAVGDVLFTTYLLPFEMTAVLLTAAVVGALMIAQHKIKKVEG